MSSESPTLRFVVIHSCISKVLRQKAEDKLRWYQEKYPRSQILHHESPDGVDIVRFTSMKTEFTLAIAFQPGQVVVAMGVPKAFFLFKSIVMPIVKAEIEKLTEAAGGELLSINDG
jgi:hypothetical protein